MPTATPRGSAGGAGAERRRRGAGWPANGARVFASPLAKRLAKDAGIELGAISGSGPHGRVVKSDVEAAKSGKTPLKAPRLPRPPPAPLRQRRSPAA